MWVGCLHRPNSIASAVFNRCPLYANKGRKKPLADERDQT
ncbi:hypothetical protein BFV94_4531 [Alteromonas macleodii]|uniref:Uncharacterized protein n=1 Tax=Alteromonas macleodii TaxID=28108 RepID=A0AB36FMW7_ALTMA|nr:hypothetical protein BFV93_4748 [Alteromonas macleodii]OES24782.1 hypothetical protein BFV95_4541 [Alteromonas macleodii]OES25060.1 hypothetical protein BFV94_4531 [Alteromonas macleodii]